MGKIAFQPNFTADTGDHTDEARNISGAIKAIQWHPATGDTGAGLTLAVSPSNLDTGHDEVFYTAPAGAMGGNFKVADTGALSNVFTQMDDIRVRYLNGTTLAGTLYVWYDENKG